jgi:hypothetical protein
MPDHNTLSLISLTAANEGWMLAKQTDGTFAGLIMIANDQALDRFECDVDAEQFVRHQAAQGSEIHRLALSIHKRPMLAA